jgi:hypothetical protein
VSVAVVNSCTAYGVRGQTSDSMTTWTTSLSFGISDLGLTGTGSQHGLSAGWDGNNCEWSIPLCFQMSRVP